MARSGAASCSSAGTTRLCTDGPHHNYSEASASRFIKIKSDGDLIPQEEISLVLIVLDEWSARQKSLSDQNNYRQRERCLDHGTAGSNREHPCTCTRKN